MMVQQEDIAASVVVHHLVLHHPDLTAHQYNSLTEPLEVMKNSDEKNKFVALWQ